MVRVPLEGERCCAVVSEGSQDSDELTVLGEEGFAKLTQLVEPDRESRTSLAAS
jgi:hypothetical protein